MDLGTPDPRPTSTDHAPDRNVGIGSKRPGARRPGPDVVRALAMAGVVVMNYHGYLVIQGATSSGSVWYELFDFRTGPLTTRFAATFVLTAGVGVTLMTASSIGDRRRVKSMRWRLVKRGLLLYVVGLWFDTIWRGTILSYYGIMFVIAAWLFTLRTRWVLGVGAAAAVAGAAIRWWRYEQTLAGHDTRWLTNPDSGTVGGFVFDVFVNGTHPLLPWLAFFCTGIVVGRVLTTDWWRSAALGAGFVLYGASLVIDTSISSGRGAVLLNDNPLDRGLVYTASALGTALIAFATVSWVADRFAATRTIDVLQRAGQMSLTIYLSHALVFKLLVDWLDIIEPAGLTTSLTFAFGFWIVALIAAVAYQQRYGRGPAERLYRALTN